MLAPSASEEEIKRRLKKRFEELGRGVALKEVQMPKTGNGDDMTCKPDFVAYKTVAEKFYIIECKKCSRLRYVGHAFGQILVTKTAIQRMPREAVLRWLEETTGKRAHNPLLEFGVAFPGERYDSSESVQFMVKSIHSIAPFRDFAVFIAGPENVEELYDGVDFPLERLLG